MFFRDNTSDSDARPCEGKWLAIVRAEADEFQPTQNKQSTSPYDK